MASLLRYITPVLLLAAISSGCQKESSTDTVSYDLTFSTQMADETKAGQYTVTDLSSLSTFKVYGYDGSTQVINGGDVNKTSMANVWLLAGNPIGWPEGKTMTFWASANLPAWASVSSTSSASATLSITAVPTNAADQWDPLVGYYTGKGDKGNANLTFYHPLTAVKFVTGSLGDAIHSVTGITSVKIKNVYKSGTATISEATPITFSWIPGSSMTDVTGSFSGTESAKPFLLIPQNLGTKNVTLELTVSTSSGTKTMNAKLTSGEWLAGKTNIYTLDYINNEFGENIVVTLTDWGTEKSTSEKDYFDANYK